jgi:hypothetical protein
MCSLALVGCGLGILVRRYMFMSISTGRIITLTIGRALKGVHNLAWARFSQAFVNDS